MSPSGLVAGRFRVLGLLGSGGTAVVYRAHDVLADEVVALKVSHPHADPARLHDEARATRGVDHPNVVRALAEGDLEDGRAWVALGLVDGSSLADRVDRDGPLDPAEAIALADGLLDALAAVHAAGLVHRDVSPLNVHVLPGAFAADRVRLLDLGLAGPTGTAAAIEGAGALGNPGYVSPEQSRGAPVDARGDVYQAGATLYLALTGRPPFGDGTAQHLVDAHRAAPPPVPSAARPGLPAALDRLVVTAMLKEPAQRYPSAAAMRAAAHAAAGATAPGPGTRLLPVVTRADEIHRSQLLVAARVPDEVVPPAPAQGPVRSNRGVAPVVLVMLVVLAAVVGVSWWARAAADPVADPPTPIATTATTAPSPTPTRSRSVGARPRPSPTPTITVVTVPVVTGMSTAEAVAAIEALGLRAGAVALTRAATAGDTVLGSTPAAGASVPAGSAVDLVAASGSTLVPLVVGLSVDDAEAVLRAAGLVPERSGDGVHGVLASSPPATVELPVGSTVTLELGTPQPQVPDPTPTATEASTP